MNGSDRPSILAISYIYEIPVGKDRSFGSGWHPVLKAIVEDWKASAVQIYQSGAPFGISCGQNLYGAGAARCSYNYGVPLVNPNWNPNNPNSSYINKAAFYQPANGVFGNLGAVVPGLRNPAQKNENVALSRIFNTGERKSLEFRVSASNVANRHWLSGITTTETSSAFGEFTNSQAELPRNIEFNLRFKF
jgi:hypothetical protein